MPHDRALTWTAVLLLLLLQVPFVESLACLDLLTVVRREMRKRRGENKGRFNVYTHLDLAFCCPGTRKS